MNDPILTSRPDEGKFYDSPADPHRIRDLSGLSPQLIGLEGCRVVVTRKDGRNARFRVGRSTGWRPCHLELHNARSLGGDPADKHYVMISVIANPKTY